jgi:hypothetical protein
MESFDDAKKLFNDYQKNGRFHSLKDSLNILDEIIATQGADEQRAIKFKGLIKTHIDSRINDIYSNANIDEFAKRANIEEELAILSESLSKEQMKRFMRLLRIKIDYFE